MTETNVKNLDFHELARRAAENSPSDERKVGAVVVSFNEEEYATGWNTLADVQPAQPGQEPAVHAEINALLKFATSCTMPPEKIYVTHQPCQHCLAAIKEAGINQHNIILVEKFLKFDKDKPAWNLLPRSASVLLPSRNELTETWDDALLRTYLMAQVMYDTDPPAASKILLTMAEEILGAWGVTELFALNEVAHVLALGAKKYKPGNWRKVEDVGRYWAALGRHLYQATFEEVDEDLGTNHYANALTNILFILELEAKNRQ